MKKYAPKLLILFIVILTLALFISEKTRLMLTGNKKEDLEDTNITNNHASSPQVEWTCPYNELSIDKLPPEVQSNEVAIKTIKENCLWADAQLVDLNADKIEEIIITGVGYGCGSCHAKVVFIINEDKVVFQYEGDDIVIMPTANGFRLEEPVRKENEPLCCPSESVVYEYNYYPEEGLYRSANRIAPTGEIKPLSW